MSAEVMQREEQAVVARIEALNARRRAARAARDGASADEDERYFAREYGSGHKLAVYGTLAPGRSNHGQVAPLGGVWRAGLIVHGDLYEQGWGATMGYPALRWRPGAGGVPVQLLTAERLIDAWPRLDAFEGDGYVRILVPLYDGPQLAAVANLYEAAPLDPQRLRG